MKFIILRFAALAIMSLPVRGAWIEMLAAACGGFALASLPVRGAWIEIRTFLFVYHRMNVTPLTSTFCNDMVLKLRNS